MKLGTTNPGLMSFFYSKDSLKVYNSNRFELRLHNMSVCNDFKLKHDVDSLQINDRCNNTDSPLQNLSTFLPATTKSLTPSSRLQNTMRRAQKFVNLYFLVC